MNWLITCFIAGVTQSVLAGTNEHPSSELTGDEEVYIFDVDGGADDIFGLVLSLLNPSQGRILAITTVFGDTDVFNATENVLRTLQLVNRTEVPVYRGSQGGLVFTPPSDFYYGRDGIGDNNWNETVRLHAENTPAAVFLADTVNALPGKVTVVSTGPLTNIALAQHLNPSFFKRLRHLYIMGGAYQGRGNVRPGVEFNFFEDPHAAEYVLLESHNQTVINLFPMETAPNIPLEWRTKTLEQIDSKYLKFLDIAERNATYDTYWTPFDESTMATAFNTKLISEAFKADGSVLTEGGDAKGLLVIDYSSNQHNLNVVTKIDREAFQDYVYATLRLSHLLELVAKPTIFFFRQVLRQLTGIESEMKPAIVADEMFPEGAGPYMDFEEAGGSSGLLMDLAANEKAVHADFFNDFEDLFDDDNLD